MPCRGQGHVPGLPAAPRRLRRGHPRRGFARHQPAPGTGEQQHPGHRGHVRRARPGGPPVDGHRRGRARRHRGEPPGGALPRRTRRAPEQADGRAHHQRPLGRTRVGDQRGPLADPPPARHPRHPPRLHLPAPQRPQSHRHLHRRPQLPRQSREQPPRRRRRQTGTPARRRLPGHLRKRRGPGRAVEPGLAE